MSFLLSGIAFIILFASACAHHPKPIAAVSLKELQVQGHRGARARFPENTLPAFQHALEAGADVLELDLAMTKDQVLVISHDPHVNPNLCRFPGGRQLQKDLPLPIRSLTWREMQDLDCGSQGNPRFPLQKKMKAGIPRFEDFLQWLATSPHPQAQKIQINIETKIFPRFPELAPEPAEFVGAIVTLLQKFQMVDRSFIQSFDVRTLKVAFQLCPELRRVQLISDNHLELIKMAIDLNLWAISPDHEWILSEDIQAFHQYGVRIIPWTANTPSDWKRLIDMKVDGIITDDPQGLIQYKKTLE